MEDFKINPVPRPNRLINQKSPYLLQHAYNPVDWFPWGDEALNKAAGEDKPIFLSIGYSSCHWCHVMEHECFEDPEVASYLNTHFVAIKVDREERPDLDQIYMRACQILTGTGGWPLTIIMTPNGEPFFAGTYFPKRAKFGMPGLLDVLDEAIRLWRSHKSRAFDLSKRVADAIQSRSGAGSGGLPTKEALDVAFEELSLTFDEEYGGFGMAPKFPSPHALLFLLRYWHRYGKSRAIEMLEKTLSAIQRGGIYDHIGFGFARYSTDRMWLVPHFEKMLYDNALLAYVYLEAYQATKKIELADTARNIFAYVERVMTSKEGAFYSSEDADSEGEEGKFYKWTVCEIKEVLGDKLGNLACRIFGFDSFDNPEAEGIPNLIEASFKEIADTEGVSLDTVLDSYEKARKLLFKARELRVHPSKDEKILTSWNGLMIAAFSKGSMVIGDKRYATIAKRAADFILSNLRNQEGRLLARYRDGEAAYLAYLDDYAFLVWGLSELYQSTFESRYLEEAVRLNKEMIRLFWDDRHGGFYFTARDGEKLLTRSKEIYDSALPSGNSVATLDLLRIMRLTGDDEARAKAEAQLSAFSGEVARNPSAYTFFLTAVLYWIGPSHEVVISGLPENEDFQRLINVVRSGYRPNDTIVISVTGKSDQSFQKLIPLIGNKPMRNGKATAYVCSNQACQAPTNDAGRLESYLSK